MKDEAMNTDVELILKDKGVNTQEDHCYCRRYVQKRVNTAVRMCREQAFYTACASRRESHINTDAGMDTRFFSSSSPFEMLKGDDSQTRFCTSLSSYKVLETILTLLNPLMAMIMILASCHMGMNCFWFV